MVKLLVRKLDLVWKISIIFIDTIQYLACVLIKSRLTEVISCVLGLFTNSTNFGYTHVASYVANIMLEVC